MRSFLLIIGLFAAASVSAQRQPAPFSTLEFYGNATADVWHSDLFDLYWLPDAGLGGGVAMPFYAGTVEVGGALHQYQPILSSVPSFSGAFVYAGWGLRAQTGRFGFYGGTRLGMYRMAFDEDTFAGVRNESELKIGLVTRLDIDLGRDVALYGEAAGMRTYTFIRLHQLWVQVGVRVRVQTPAFVRKVLE